MSSFIFQLLSKNTLSSYKINYDFLPDAYNDTLILTESLEKIIADKIISLPATQKYIRYRDIWDLTWLHQQGAKLNMTLVRQKINDYRIVDYDQMLEKLIAKLPNIIAGKVLSNEMKRFIPNDVFNRTLAQDKFQQYLSNTLMTLFKNVQKQLDQNNTEPEFKM